MDLVTSAAETENQAEVKPSTHSTSAATPAIAEAQGWIVDQNGEVLLVAYAPTVSPDRWQPAPNCITPSTPQN